MAARAVPPLAFHRSVSAHVQPNASESHRRKLSSAERSGRPFAKGASAAAWRAQAKGEHGRRVAPRERLEATSFGSGEHKPPVFFKQEDPDRLMRHPPPFGYKFQSITADRVRQLQRNATMPQQKAFGSCAVVGNSGTLKLRTLGAEIDAHDAVFRVNHAPAPSTPEGHKHVAYAGSRTTWRVVTSRWFDEEKRNPTQTLLVVCDRPFIYSCQNILFENGPKPLAHSVNPLFYGAVRRHTGASKIPLAGLVAAAIAVSSCQTVDVYGLSTMQYDERKATPGSPRVCGYYYACGGAPGLASDRAYHSRPGDAEYHDFRAHAQTLLKWNRSGVVRIRVR